MLQALLDELLLIIISNQQFKNESNIKIKINFFKKVSFLTAP